MCLPPDRDPPADPNPYQSPICSDLDAEPAELLKNYLGGAIEMRGSLQPNDVFLAHFQNSWGFTGFTVATWLATAFVLAWGAAVAVLLPYAAGEARGSCFVWVLLAGIEAIVVLILMSIGLRWISARRLKQLWDQRVGIFAEQVRRITIDGIQFKSAGDEIDTPWSDYACHRLFGHRLMLQLSPKALRRRRQVRSDDNRIWKAGSLSLDKIDIFPREQFNDRAEWTLFSRLVKQKVRRRW